METQIDGEVTVNVSISVPIAEFAHWDPDRVERLRLGIRALMLDSNAGLLDTLAPQAAIVTPRDTLELGALDEIEAHNEEQEQAPAVIEEAEEVEQPAEEAKKIDPYTTVRAPIDDNGNRLVRSKNSGGKCVKCGAYPASRRHRADCLGEQFSPCSGCGSVYHSSNNHGYYEKRGEAPEREPKREPKRVPVRAASTNGVNLGPVASRPYYEGERVDPVEAGWEVNYVGEERVIMQPSWSTNKIHKHMFKVPPINQEYPEESLGRCACGKTQVFVN